MSFTIGAVTILEREFEDFGYPQFAQLVRILSDGSSTQNEVLQSGSLPLRQAQVHGVTDDYFDIEELRDYGRTLQAVTYSDDQITISVRVLDFKARRMSAIHWEFDALLVERAGASGSGS